MRIIAGRDRGRRLFAPAGEETRPTSDKVKESLFNIIRGDVEGATVLDLFAGSGALALEALSRGAKHAVLCDRSRQAMEAIRRNVALLKAEDSVTLIPGDWRRAVEAPGFLYTLVFFDPPYRMAQVYRDAAEALVRGGRLSDGALLVMEHGAEVEIGGLPGEIRIEDERRYRDTCLTLARYAPRESGDKE